MASLEATYHRGAIEAFLAENSENIFDRSRRAGDQQAAAGLWVSQ